MGGFLGDIAEKLTGEAGRELGEQAGYRFLKSGSAFIKSLAPEAGSRFVDYLSNAQDEIEAAKAKAGDVGIKAVSGAKSGESLANAMEGKAAPDLETNYAAALSHKHLSDMQSEFETRGLADPANRQPDYFPHKVAPENWGPSKKEKLIKKLVASGSATDEADANRMIQYMKFGGGKAGHFEMPRLKNFPLYRKDLSVVPETLVQGAARLKSADWFGPKDEVISKMLLDIERESKSRMGSDYAKSYASQFLGRSVLNDPKVTGLATRDVSRLLSSVEAAAHLSLAVASHANKPLNVMLMHGIGPLAKGMFEAATNYEDARQFTMDIGALGARAVEEFKNQYGPETPIGQSLGPKILHMSGLYNVDRFFRTVASVAGKMAGEDYAGDLLKDPTNRRLQAKLLQLGIEPSAVIKEGGFTKEMAMKAAKRTSDITQFRSDVSSTPLWWRDDPWGRMVGMFHSFYFQQAKFFKDTVVKPAIEYHDFRPLAYLALVAPFAAEPFADLRNLIRGTYRYRPGFNHPLDRAVDNMIQGGVLGMFYELPMSLSTPYENLFWLQALGQLAGPPLTSVVSAAATTRRIVTSKHPLQAAKTAAERRVIYDTPFIGPWAYHHFFPPKRPYKGPLEKGVLTQKAKQLLGGM